MSTNPTLLLQILLEELSRKPAESVNLSDLLLTMDCLLAFLLQ